MRTRPSRAHLLQKLPKLEGKTPLLLDPMLATGGSAAQALDLIKEAGKRPALHLRGRGA
jgi:uracil phosphoribosyltransferase